MPDLDLKKKKKVELKFSKLEFHLKKITEVAMIRTSIFLSF